MKIIYLNGPYHKLAYSRSSRSPAVTRSGTIYYPLGLAYAAGWAQKQSDFSVELLDAVARKWDQNQTVFYLKEAQPDLVFCDTSTPSIYEDMATAEAIKKVLPGCRVVMVGTHATALPEAILAPGKQIDAVARGEYDETAVDLACAIQQDHPWDTVPGLSYRQGNQIVHTSDRPLLRDLDQLPFVSRTYHDFLRVEDYFFAAAQYPMVMIMTSRGCPHKCAWCLYPQVMHRGKYRMRSSENVAREFAYIAREMPSVREVGIEDDLFTGDKKRLHEICELLIKQKNRLNFWCDTRIDLDRETMRLLKAAGCRLLIAGFENAEQQILDRIRKGIDIDQAYQFMADARRTGLLVHGCFVLGNPGETRDTIRNTLKFARKLNPDTVQFFPMMVYPGTEMYSWTRQEGYLRTEDYNEWLTPDGLHNSVVDLPGLSGREILEYCDLGRREFYLRRGYVFRKLAQSLKNRHEAQRNVKAFCRFARYLVKT